MSTLTHGDDSHHEPWPSPKPLDEYDLPNLPLNLLPSWVANHAEAVSQFTQTPPSPAGLLGVSVLGLTAGRWLEVKIKDGYREPLNIWTLSLLPSGHLKSPVFEKMMAPLEAIEDNPGQLLDDEDTSSSPSDSAEESDEEEEGVKFQLFAQDTTPQALRETLWRQGERIGVFSSEGGPLKILAGRWGGSQTDTEVFKKGWAGERLYTHRKTEESFTIRRPALTMGLTLQPKFFQRLVETYSFHFEGLLARYLYAYPTTRIGYRKTGEQRPSLDQEAQQKYRRNIRKLFKLRLRHQEQSSAGRPTTLRLNNSARDRFNSWEAWVERNLRPEGDLAEIREWGLKLTGQVARIAGLFAMADRIKRPTDEFHESLDVHGRHIGRATDLVEALIPHARRALGEIQPDSRYQLGTYILDRIAELSDEEREDLTLSSLHQRTKGKSGLRETDELREVVDYLADHDYLRLVEQPSEGPGRKPSPSVEVNPHVVENR